MTPFEEQLRQMTNVKLAEALEYIGSCMRGGISDGILNEAAKRLRAEPQPHFVEPPPKGNPPRKAYAIPD
jgi:hypothetical protein